MSESSNECAAPPSGSQFRLCSSSRVFRFNLPCPYCGGKVLFRATAWVQEDDGTWAADSGDLECDSEPAIDLPEWHEWNNAHGSMDYGEAWHRYHEGAVAALKRKVRFDMDHDSETANK
jgi:hypothetical protein